MSSGSSSVTYNNAAAETGPYESLIDISKEKGFLTYDEINDAFQENFSVEEMDNLLETLGCGH